MLSKILQNIWVTSRRIIKCNVLNEATIYGKTKSKKVIVYEKLCRLTQQVMGN